MLQAQTIFPKHGIYVEVTHKLVYAHFQADFIFYIIYW